MYITNIDWDSKDTGLPKEIDIPREMDIDEMPNIWHLKLAGAATALL